MACELTSAMCADPWQGLYLGSNQIGEDAKSKLQEVVQGRSGFQLGL